MGWSTFLRAQLQDLESQHRELADKLAALEPRVVKSTFRDTRRFVEARLKNLQSMLTGEPRLVRAEIAKHIERITLTPEGRTYIAAGASDLLGDVAARMVPGARHGPNVCRSDSNGWRRSSANIWKRRYPRQGRDGR